MEIIEKHLNAVIVIQLKKHEDHRGFFMEIYNEESFKKLGLNNVFVQDNCSFTKDKGTLRGLHYQKEPYAQSKLIRCTKGEILDISVDLRKGSPTYGRPVLIKLSENDGKLVLVPKGFAHGVLVLKDNSEYNYKVDNLFNKEYDRGLAYDDKTININYKDYIDVELKLSDRDLNNPKLDDIDNNFEFVGGNNEYK